MAKSKTTDGRGREHAQYTMNDTQYTIRKYTNTQSVMAKNKIIDRRREHNDRHAIMLMGMYQALPSSTKDVLACTKGLLKGL